MFFRFSSDLSKPLPVSEKTQDTSEVSSDAAPVEVPSDTDSATEVPSDSEGPTASDSEVPADSETVGPTEFPAPPLLILNGTPILLNGISCDIASVYLRGIATGVFIGGGVGSLVGALAGFVVSTLSVPILLLGDFVSNSIDVCRKKNA
jgi:hypothetical protein